MARKPLARRLAETEATLELWKAAGMEQARPAQFMRDMIARMRRNRGMSTGQRKFLDSLIDQGAPVVHNKELTDRIARAMEVAGMERCRQPLSDFSFKLSKGWSLSPKQQAFLDNMLEQADKLRDEGLPELSESDAKLVAGVLAACRRQSNWHWSHRGGAHAAYRAAEEMMERHNTLSHRALARLKQSNKSVTRRYENPRLLPGTLGYVRRDAAMIMTAPYFNEYGQLVQDVLVNGELKTVPEDSLGKRRSRAVA